MSDNLEREILERMTAGKSVMKSLPFNGELHMERVLPFLLVYRFTNSEPDSEVSRLVRAEASYLIAAAKPDSGFELRRAVKRIVSQVSSEYNAFLILEVWLRAPGATNGAAQSQQNALFRIITSKYRPPANADRKSVV